MCLLSLAQCNSLCPDYNIHYNASLASYNVWHRCPSYFISSYPTEQQAIDKIKQMRKEGISPSDKDRYIDVPN